jgi:two-component SAPR family response regulator
MVITCIIIDDEITAIQHLKKFIVRMPLLVLIASFTDPEEAIRYVDDHPIDLVFLDVEMPNFAIDGLDFMRLCGNRYTYIFTTAYPTYALPDYETNAVDFLHKPFDFNRFSQAVLKAKTVLELVHKIPGTENDDYPFI